MVEAIDLASLVSFTTVVLTPTMDVFTLPVIQTNSLINVHYISLLYDKWDEFYYHFCI
jgi:hypothetical protein